MDTTKRTFSLSLTIAKEKLLFHFNLNIRTNIYNNDNDHDVYEYTNTILHRHRTVFGHAISIRNTFVNETIDFIQQIGRLIHNESKLQRQARKWKDECSKFLKKDCKNDKEMALYLNKLGDNIDEIVDAKKVYESRKGGGSLEYANQQDIFAMLDELNSSPDLAFVKLRCAERNVVETLIHVTAITCNRTGVRGQTTFQGLIAAVGLKTSKESMKKKNVEPMWKAIHGSLPLCVGKLSFSIFHTNVKKYAELFEANPTKCKFNPCSSRSLFRFPFQMFFYSSPEYLLVFLPFSVRKSFEKHQDAFKSIADIDAIRNALSEYEASIGQASLKSQSLTTPGRPPRHPASLKSSLLPPPPSSRQSKSRGAKAPGKVPFAIEQEPAPEKTPEKLAIGAKEPPKKSQSSRPPAILPKKTAVLVDDNDEAADEDLLADIMSVRIKRVQKKEARNNDRKRETKRRISARERIVVEEAKIFGDSQKMIAFLSK